MPNAWHKLLNLVFLQRKILFPTSPIINLQSPSTTSIDSTYPYLYNSPQIHNLPIWKTNVEKSSTCQCFPFSLFFPTLSRLYDWKTNVLITRYVPRKCSATNRIIKAKDHASVQISVGKVDENGRYTGENQVYALCGFVRAMGEGDDSLNRLAQRDGYLDNVWSAAGGVTTH